MTVDLVIKNGKILTCSGISDGGIAVDRGIIVAIAKDMNLPRADEVIDVCGNLVLPGVIDAHVHFRDPGLTHEEDFKTGSMAAAAGGVTTIIDMPSTVTPRQPLTVNVKRLKEKIEIAKSKSCVDFGLNALIALIPSGKFQELEDIKKLAESGVLGFKMFLGTSIGKIPIMDDGTVLAAFRAVAHCNLPLLVHAENEGIIRYSTAKLKSEKRTDYMAHVESRPNIAEAEAIQRALIFAGETKAKLHIVHVSSKEGVDLIRSAKEKGIHVTAETCPHYLLLSREDVMRLGGRMVVNPPVRSKENGQRLMEGLRTGHIDIITTDHAPVASEEKNAKNVWEVRGGFPGVETSVPLMLTQVNKGLLSLRKYVELSSTNPARIFGLYPKKGTIGLGSDGDFTIVDLKKEGKIRSGKLKSKAKTSPFDNWKVKGMPIYTIVRGKIVMQNEQLDSKPWGQLISPIMK